MGTNKVKYLIVFLVLIALLLPATLIMHGTMSRERKLQPTITLKGEETVTIEKGEEYEEPGYTAEDGMGDDITWQVKTSTPKMEEVGTYEVRYYVKDKHGNVAWTSRTVEVVKKKN